eukprot:TRINITY_DN13608_c0_g1_i1.p2 TRINITY_DN13608_c0_g1~~TRINITY_DN13608_c0_g1_i1.p2  ORF type:complete len:170 (+),score=10.39 TRINITY_DN13608_c0_g1_i1:236-745(+)
MAFDSHAPRTRTTAWTEEVPHTTFDSQYTAVPHTTLRDEVVGSQPIIHCQTTAQPTDCLSLRNVVTESHVDSQPIVSTVAETHYDTRVEQVPKTHYDTRYFTQTETDQCGSAPAVEVPPVPGCQTRITPSPLRAHPPAPVTAPFGPAKYTGWRGDCGTAPAGQHTSGCC